LHAGIGYVTPEDEHLGRGGMIRKQRAEGLRAARAARLAPLAPSATRQLNRPTPPVAGSFQAGMVRRLRSTSIPTARPRIACRAAIRVVSRAAADVENVGRPRRCQRPRTGCSLAGAGACLVSLTLGRRPRSCRSSRYGRCTRTGWCARGR
jgi:hypothetical protein